MAQRFQPIALVAAAVFGAMVGVIILEGGRLLFSNGFAPALQLGSDVEFALDAGAVGDEAPSRVPPETAQITATRLRLRF